MSARTIGGVLRAIVGADHVLDAPDRLAAVAVDGVTPRWRVRPGTVEQIASVVALAHDEGLAVAVRGTGTHAEMGHPPARLDVVVETGRLDGIFDYNADDLTVSVQAGVTGAALAARLGPQRQLLPLDPPGWAERTLGGMAATQASGPLRLRYGTLRDLVLGVRFVQADGVTTWGGARVVKSVSGYDVPKLLVGSLGTLGVLAEMTLRLHPAPEFEATRLASFSSIAHAEACALDLLNSTIQPSRLELLDAGLAAACGLPSRCALAISIGTVEPAVRDQDAEVAAAVTRARGASETMGSTFWRTYDRVLAAGGGTTLRIGTVPARLAATVTALQEALPGVAVGGCAALGALRARWVGEDLRAVAAAIGRVRTATAEVDGGVVVERGPRALREAIDPWGPVPEPALGVMRALKREFDGRGVLNPGRFVDGL